MTCLTAAYSLLVLLGAAGGFGRVAGAFFFLSRTPFGLFLLLFRLITTSFFITHLATPFVTEQTACPPAPGNRGLPRLHL